MNRLLLAAALALACACSPALASTHPSDGSGLTLMPWCLAAMGAFLIFYVAAMEVRSDRLPRVLTGVMVFAWATAVSTGAYAQAAAVAQPATDTAVVTVPYGTWLTSGAAGIQEIVVSIVMAIIAFACRKLPAAIGTVLKGILTQQLVERAIAFGMNTVTGAAKDKVLSVPVGNAVLANALNYVLEHAPAWFVKWTGGEAAIRDHIIALLPVAPDASLANATPTATDPVAANG